MELNFKFYCNSKYIFLYLSVKTPIVSLNSGRTILNSVTKPFQFKVLQRTKKKKVQRTNQDAKIRTNKQQLQVNIHWCLYLFYGHVTLNSMNGALQTKFTFINIIIIIHWSRWPLLASDKLQWSHKFATTLSHSVFRARTQHIKNCTRVKSGWVTTTTKKKKTHKKQHVLLFIFCSWRMRRNTTVQQTSAWISSSQPKTGVHIMYWTSERHSVRLTTLILGDSTTTPQSELLWNHSLALLGEKTIM